MGKMKRYRMVSLAVLLVLLLTGCRNTAYIVRPDALRRNARFSLNLMYSRQSDYEPRYASVNGNHCEAFLECLEQDGYAGDGEIHRDFNVEGVQNIANITPKGILDATDDIEVFLLNRDYCFLWIGQKVYRYDCFGGRHYQLCLWDYDGNGVRDLVSYNTYGSGLLYLCAEVLDLTQMERKVIHVVNVDTEPSFSFRYKNDRVYLNGKEVTYSDGSFHCEGF